MRMPKHVLSKQSSYQSPKGCLRLCITYSDPCQTHAYSRYSHQEPSDSMVRFGVYLYCLELVACAIKHGVSRICTAWQGMDGQSEHAYLQSVIVPCAETWLCHSMG